MVLGDNPIGQRGGRAVLRALNRMIKLGTLQTGRQILLDKCNYDVSSAYDLFDPQEPGGNWTCDLTDPYDRAVAWELVELAWTEQGENWLNETLDGKPYNLPEPEQDETWTRQDFQLPHEGVLSVQYVVTAKVPRFSNCIDEEMFEVLTAMMYRSPSDHGLRIVKLAACEFYFTARYIGNRPCAHQICR